MSTEIIGGFVSSDRKASVVQLQNMSEALIINKLTNVDEATEIVTAFPGSIDWSSRT